MKVCPFCNNDLGPEDKMCPSCGRRVEKTLLEKVENKEKKRGFIRVPTKGKVKFQPLSLDPQGSDLSLEGKIDNISLSGICFDIDNNELSHRLSYLRVSSIVWMKFSLPGREAYFKVQGEIKRVRPFPNNVSRLGVMFINLHSADYKTINDFISSNG